MITPASSAVALNLSFYVRRGEPDPAVMGNFSEALAAEIKRLRQVLERIRDVPGNDVERLKRIAREALEEK